MSDWSITQTWGVLGGVYCVAQIAYYWARAHYLSRIAWAIGVCSSCLLGQGRTTLMICQLSGGSDDYTETRAREVSGHMNYLISMIPKDKDCGVFMLRWHALKLEKHWIELMARYDEADL